MLPHVKGKYVKLFSADDVLRNTGLEDLVNFMEDNPEISFAFGNVRYVNHKRISLETSWFENRDSFSMNNDEITLLKLFLNLKATLPFAGNMITSSALNTITLNKTCIMYFDVILWVALMLKGKRLGYLDKIIADYRIHKHQMSAIKNTRFVNKYCAFEHFALFQNYLNMDDIVLARQLFKDSKYIDRLTSKEDISFIVAEYSYKISYFKSFGYLVLLNSMEKNNLREKIEKKFDFGIKEFREWCGNGINTEKNNNIDNHNSLSRLKRSIVYAGALSGESLSFKHLCILFLLKIYRIVRRVLTENRNKKKYSL
jgi:hypothetical protein